MKITKTQLAIGNRLADQIRQRPAYHLASVWLETYALEHPTPRAPADYPHGRWISIGWSCNIMRTTFGGNVREDTMAVALADHGFDVRFYRGRAETDLSELVLLECLREQRETRHQPWPFADLSDPVEVPA